MAKFKSGIFSMAAGSIGGVVFSKARTREGKLMTARERVIPTNPQTPAQQLNRMNFKDTLGIVRDLGPGYYRGDWNRAISELPGYQSLFSVLSNSKKNYDGRIKVIDVQPDILLGDLDPTPFAFSHYGGAEFQLSWNASPSGNQQENDFLKVFFLGTDYGFGSLPYQRTEKRITHSFDRERKEGSFIFDLVDLHGRAEGVLAVLYFSPGAGSPVLSPSSAQSIVANVQ